MNQHNTLIPHRQLPTTPDYALQIPAHIQHVLGLGLLSGLGGLLMVFTVTDNLRFIAYILLSIGVLAVVLVLLLVVVTGSGRRLRARQTMIDAVSWRGDEQVLDVGCGNGFLLVEVAKHLTTGKATGIDLWKTDAGLQTMQATRHNAQLAGVTDRIDVKDADARTMPFDDNSFDVIVSSLMLHHAGSNADRRQVIQEMIRVVEPGGTILLYDMLPIIADAGKQMKANGFVQIKQRGGLMKVLSANKPH